MASSGSAMRKLPNLGRGPQVVAVLLIAGLLGAMAIQPTRQLLDQNRRISAMAGDLSKIEATNEKLRMRIERLQDPDFIEQQAREQAGLVKPGEVVYRVNPPSEDVVERKQEAKAAKTAPPPPTPGLVERFLNFVGLL